MTKAIEAGIPKLRIEEAAAIKQARIDSGKDILVGVNRYQNPVTDNLQILEIDNEKVKQQQEENLRLLRLNRNNSEVKKALAALTEVASKKNSDNHTKDMSENLLALAVNAARQRATLGEISDALEVVYGRYRAQNQTVSGVFSKEMTHDISFEKARKISDSFAEKAGRRPRIMIAKIGQDGHDRGARVVATAYADIGFDVDIGPLFQTPEEAAKQAVENDVHILGVSSLTAGHKTLVPQLIRALANYGRSDIMVIIGGVIPRQDYDFLLRAGVQGIYGPGTKISDAAIEVLEKLQKAT
jgi:methylmalonyl-CoA mutase